MKSLLTKALFILLLFLLAAMPSGVQAGRLEIAVMAAIAATAALEGGAGAREAIGIAAVAGGGTEAVIKTVTAVVAEKKAVVGGAAIGMVGVIAAAVAATGRRAAAAIIVGTAGVAGTLIAMKAVDGIERAEVVAAAEAVGETIGEKVAVVVTSGAKGAALGVAIVGIARIKKAFMN